MTQGKKEKAIIHDLLLENRSKQHITAVVNYVGKDKTRVAALFELILDNILFISFRAAWVLGDHARRFPNTKSMYINKLIKSLDQSLEVGIKRNFCRILQESRIAPSQQGIVATKCFDFLQAPKESIAVKSFCMTTLFNIVKHEPELKRELILVIENLLPQASAGIKNKAKHILKDLESISLN